MDSEVTAYYVHHSTRLLLQISIFNRPLHAILQKEFSRSVALHVKQAIKREFISLLPLIPYIGGSSNPLTKNLIGAAWMLAVYRVMKPMGKSPGEVGKIVYEAITKLFSIVPKGLLRRLAAWRYNERYIYKLKYLSKRSYLKEYLGDFIFDVIDSDGKSFDLGVDYRECGILKFLMSQNAAELAPYVCELDYAMSSSYGLKLERKKTLANGDDICDFRFKRS